jgi:hypothetical protein
MEVPHGSTCAAGSSCDYTCDAGYEPHGRMKCSGGGILSNSTFSGGSCVGVTCARASPTANAGACPATRYGSGSSCTVQCSHGYTQSSGSGAYTCGTDGLWAGGGLVCVGVTCAAAAPPGVAHATECAQGQYNDGLICTAGCERGYERQGSATSAQYSCGADGQWTAGSLVCGGKQCTGLPPTPYGGSLVQTSANYPNTATFSCDERHAFISGDAQWVCTVDQAGAVRYLDHNSSAASTSANLPQCVSCPEIEHCSTDQLTCRKDHWWSKTSTSTCETCDEGYRGHDSTNFAESCVPVLCDTLPGTH